MTANPPGQGMDSLHWVSEQDDVSFKSTYEYRDGIIYSRFFPLFGVHQQFKFLLRL